MGKFIVTPVDVGHRARLEKSRSWRSKHPEHKKNRKPRAAGSRRNEHLKRQYGITLDTWEKIFASQGYACACCGSLKPKRSCGWSTDHDHDTGEIRGIVCHHCNVLIGTLGDTLEGLAESFSRLDYYLQRGANRTRAIIQSRGNLNGQI